MILAATFAALFFVISLRFVTVVIACAVEQSQNVDETRE